MKSNHSKANAFKHKMIKNQEELEIATRVYLGDIQFNEFKVVGFFGANFVEYAKPDYLNTFPAW